MTGLGSMMSPLMSANLSNMRQRAIPSSGETLPVVGLGTWQTFDAGQNIEERAQLKKVLQLMQEYGGKVIDSSPMYGSSEEVVGDLTQTIQGADNFFYATKVWTRGNMAGINQMQESLRKMQRETMDLMQIHNLLDWKIHLSTLKEWKTAGKIRYIGITHYTPSAHDQLEKIIKAEKEIDFVQFDYSVISRNAEKSLLKAAKDEGVAVIINQPFEGGALFSKVKGREVPEWAKEYDINSWAQFFLKYVLSHPAVNCVIPGTSKPHHLKDNMMAGYGKIPDQKGRNKMVKYIESL